VLKNYQEKNFKGDTRNLPAATCRSDDTRRSCRRTKQKDQEIGKDFHAGQPYLVKGHNVPGTRIGGGGRGFVKMGSSASLRREGVECLHTQLLIGGVGGSSDLVVLLQKNASKRRYGDSAGQWPMESG